MFHPGGKKQQATKLQGTGMNSHFTLHGLIVLPFLGHTTCTTVLYIKSNASPYYRKGLPALSTCLSSCASASILVMLFQTDPARDNCHPNGFSYYVAFTNGLRTGAGQPKWMVVLIPALFIRGTRGVIWHHESIVGVQPLRPFSALHRGPLATYQTS